MKPGLSTRTSTVFLPEASRSRLVSSKVASEQSLPRWISTSGMMCAGLK